MNVSYTAGWPYTSRPVGCHTPSPASAGLAIGLIGGGEYRAVVGVRTTVVACVEAEPTGAATLGMPPLGVPPFDG